jgi:iron complex transport system substrate-binding protein
MKKPIATLFALTALWNVAFADDTFVEVVEETDSYRLVRHLSGETQVPLDPERVVSLRPHLTDTLLALGVTPAGAAAWNNEHPEYLAEALEGVALVGSPDTPNLEAILALEPDLIVTPPYEPDLYPQLSRIAPTALLDWKTDWRDDVTDVLSV